MPAVLVPKLQRMRTRAELRGGASSRARTLLSACAVSLIAVHIGLERLGELVDVDQTITVGVVVLHDLFQLLRRQRDIGPAKDPSELHRLDEPRAVAVDA